MIALAICLIDLQGMVCKMRVGLAAFKYFPLDMNLLLCNGIVIIQFIHLIAFNALGGFKRSNKEDVHNGYSNR